MSLLKFKALAHQTRLRLLAILSRYELSVNEIAGSLEICQSGVSRHLKILAEAGLLKARRDGLQVYYKAPEEGAEARFLRAVNPFFPDSSLARADQERAASAVEERASRARQFFNEMAGKWDELNHEVLGDFDLPALVASMSPPGCAVAVDIGCGTGMVLATLCKIARLAIGVDGSSAMLERSRARLGREIESGAVSLRIGELSHLPLADHEANYACINLVLHHLPEPGEAFKEIRRILAPDGICFVADFLKHNDEIMRERYHDHWLGFSRGELEEFLSRSGYRLVTYTERRVGRKLALALLTARLRQNQ